MSGCKIFDSNTALEVLNVSCNHMFDHDIYLIGACTITSLHVQQLNISNNNIAGAGAKFIAEAITKNTSLQVLEFHTGLWSNSHRRVSKVQ